MSGAKNCPETPRQKMIGMMYLVLTAMLALNVSSEILNGFSMVDNSLHKTIESSNARNKALYGDFQFLSDQNPKKVKEWLDKALTVKQKSDELFNFIQNFKFQIVKLTDRKEANDSAYVNQIIAKDNLDKSAEYGITNGNGNILQKKIENYRDFLIQLSGNNPSKQEMYKSIFSTKNTKDGKSWQIAMFEGMPVSAVVTILTKYQSDIRTSEAEVVQFLKSQTDAMDFRVNKISALVIPNSRYVIKGGKYSAQIILSAIDSTKRPSYFIGSAPINNGKYEVNCLKSGVFTYAGHIDFTGNDGSIKPYPFKSDYIVGEPSATISNEALNVVYRGIDNRFNISVPGVASENITVKVTGGSLLKSEGKFIVRPTQDGEINIAVFAKIDGNELVMGGGVYRVKYLPNPTSYLQYNDAGGIPRLMQDGTLTKRILKSDGVSLIASYGQDELIKANFTVTSFSMVAINRSLNSNGSRFTSQMLSVIDQLEGGDLLTLKNIKAVGPDGKVRNLGLIQVQI